MPLDWNIPTRGANHNKLLLPKDVNGPLKVAILDVWVNFLLNLAKVNTAKIK